MPRDPLRKANSVALRVVHARMTQLKLIDDHDSDEFAKSMTQLQTQLSVLCYPAALKRLRQWSHKLHQDEIDQEADDLAEAAATIASGRILGCGLTFITLGETRQSLIWQFVHDAWAKRDRQKQLIIKNYSEDSSTPTDRDKSQQNFLDHPRFSILFLLLRLSRRVWTYMALAKSQDLTLGQLADCYLGRYAESGKSRQQQLSKHSKEWKRLFDRIISENPDGELDNDEPDQEESSREMTAPPGDEISDLFRNLLLEPTQTSTTEPDLSECRAVLQILLEQGSVDSEATRFPALTQTINRAIKIFRKMNSDLICQAAVEFRMATAKPGTRLPPMPRTQELLEKLGPDFKDEQEPAVVLRALPRNPRLPIVHEAPPPPGNPGNRSEDHVPQSIRIGLTLDQIPLDHPEFDIVVNLFLGAGFDDIAANLARFLDGPDNLKCNDLLRMRKYLRQWNNYVDPQKTVQTGYRAYIHAIIEDEIGKKILAIQGQIPEALDVIDDWVEGRTSRPDSWSELVEDDRLILLNALRVVLIRRIHQNLKRVYNADRTFRNESRDAVNLRESLYGRDCIIQVPRPDPSKVRRLLQDKRTDQSIRILAIAWLPDGSLVTGNSIGTVCRWVIEAKGKLVLAGSQWVGKAIFALEVFPSGLVAAASDNGSLALWNPIHDPSGTNIVFRAIHVKSRPAIFGLAKLDGNRLVAGDEKGFVAVWEIVNHTTIKTRDAGSYRLHQDSAVRALATLEPSKVMGVFSGDDSGKVIGWEVNSIMTIHLETIPWGVSALASSCTPRPTLVSVGHDRKMRVWEMSEWRQDFPTKLFASEQQLPGFVGHVRLENGCVVASVGPEVTVFAPPDYAMNSLFIHDKGLVRDIVVEDGWVYSCGEDGVVASANLIEGRIRYIEKDGPPLRCLAVQPGETPLVAAGSDDGQVFVFRPGKPKLSAVCPPRSDRPKKKKDDATDASQGL